jgi:hypothetical protein
MSRTTSPGVVNESYWAFMAGSLADFLEHISDGIWPPKRTLSPTVLADARRFVELALQHVHPKDATSASAANPEAALQAFLIAKRAEEAARQCLVEDVQIKWLLSLYRGLLNWLSGPPAHQPSDATLGVAAHMARMMRVIERRGMEIAAEERFAGWPGESE